MDGVTTALVGFVLLAIALPTIIKHRAQYYAAFGCVIVIILMSVLAHIITSDAFAKLAFVMTGLLQIVALLALLMAAGGLSARELAGEMGDAIEVIRRGETQKEVIIPLSSQKARPPVERAAAPRASAEPARTVYTIDPPGTAGAPTPLPGSDVSTPIPLE